MLNIIKNWFYKLSKINSEKIIIKQNLIVSFFDDIGGNSDIEIWKNSKVQFFWIIENKINFKINFTQKQESSSLNLNYLILSKNNSINSKIKSNLLANNTKSDVKILSIIENNWFVDLDWIVNIGKNIKKVEWSLIEENIFLWDTWKVKGIPTLLVWSSDVKANHSCKMERISDLDLFYIRSRGIWKENTLNMMIEAKIIDLFWNLKEIDIIFYNKIIKNTLNKIK